ncbi:MAG TPA: hypothetical protein VNF07_10165 [Acidimicrobiales bacterium]|nr:hypothetical protein [Acidimicrobiales bacterium]
MFEGPTPEAVILDACSAYGPEVQLSEPEEVREGGMFGFFAKRSYRVQVHAAERGPGGPRPTARATSPAAEPADTVLERLLAESPDVSYEAAAPAAPVAPERAPELETSTAHGPVAAPTFEEALARAAGAIGPEAPGAATGGDAFESLVARLRRDELSGGVFTPTEELTTDEATADEAAAHEPVDLGAPAGLAALPTTGEPAPPEKAPAPRLSPPAAVPRPLLADGLRAGSGRVVAALSSVAFPTQLLASAAGRLPTGFGVEEVFGTLPAPRPLPHVPGSLIAVVGSEEAALGHARRIAGEIGLSDGEIALARTTECSAAAGRHSRRVKRSEEEQAVRDSLAPDLYVESPEQAAALSPGWRRDRVGIVAVELPSSLEAATRGRAMLRALRPSVTLLATEAAWKAADVAYLADGLGGVDALLVDHLSQTMTPAEILAAELPVRSLDGEPADPACWVRHVEATLDRRVRGEGD